MRGYLQRPMSATVEFMVEGKRGMLYACVYSFLRPSDFCKKQQKLGEIWVTTIAYLVISVFVVFTRIQNNLRDAIMLSSQGDVLHQVTLNLLVELLPLGAFLITMQWTCSKDQVKWLAVMYNFFHDWFMDADQVPRVRLEPTPVNFYITQDTQKHMIAPVLRSGQFLLSF